MKHKTTRRSDVEAHGHVFPVASLTKPEESDECGHTVENASTADSASVAVDEQRTEQRGQYLRLAADFDNFRKRTLRDSAQQASATKDAFILDVLPILDNLERALVCDKANSAGHLHEGVDMTLRQFGQLLHRHGVEAVEDVGQPFDAQRHEALSARNDPAKPDDSVLEVIRRGYRCGERIVRPAMVIVNDWSR